MKTNEIFHSNQIETGIEIFSDKKFQITFGFEYIKNLQISLSSH